jgi:hypothetical protein
VYGCAGKAFTLIDGSDCLKDQKLDRGGARSARQMLTIEEVILRSEQGVLRPFLCKGNDGKRYFVKGRGAGYQALINEVVGGSIARMFGLPIPPFAVIDVPRELISGSTFPEIHDLGQGPAFASQYVEYAQEFSGGMRLRVPKELRIKTFIFDWWIMNQDRILVDGAGNPNLLWTVQDESMHVIDHNSAFDREFDRETFLKSHVFTDDRVGVLDRTLRSDLERTMSGILTDFNLIWANLPEEWTDVDFTPDPELVLDETYIRNILQRFETKAFWEVFNI